MKYIKTYENMDYEPEIKAFEPRYYILKGNNETMVKIIYYDTLEDFLPYKGIFIDGDIHWFPANKFEREMSEEEIKEFEEELELNMTAKKYNL